MAYLGLFSLAPAFFTWETVLSLLLATFLSLTNGGRQRHGESRDLAVRCPARVTVFVWLFLLRAQRGGPGQLVKGYLG